MKQSCRLFAFALLAGLFLFPVPANAENTVPVGTVSIVTLIDNISINPDLATDWGFAAAVILPDGSILFDAGPDGKALLANMRKLALSPDAFQKIVISHGDKDHTYGLKAFLAANAKAISYLPGNAIAAIKYVNDAGAQYIGVTEPSEIAPGVRTTGPMERFSKEQALIIDTADGLVVMTGCAHPGIVAVIEKVQALNPGKKLALVMGGFHLFQTLPERIDIIVKDFKRLHVMKVAPSHCTGDYARKRFKEVYGADYIEGGAGLTLSFKLPQ